MYSNLCSQYCTVPVTNYTHTLYSTVEDGKLCLTLLSPGCNQPFHLEAFSSQRKSYTPEGPDQELATLVTLIASRAFFPYIPAMAHKGAGDTATSRVSVPSNSIQRDR